MSDEEPVAPCDDCGRSVPLFAGVCPGCGTGCAESCETPCATCGTPVDHRDRGACPDCGGALDPWDGVVERVRRQGFHVAVPVSDRLPCPTDAGFDRGRGKPVGQRADYRRPLPDGSEIHVREYDDRYEVHRDRRSAQDRVGHLTRDAPLETAAGAVTLLLLARVARRLPGPSRGRPSSAWRSRLAALMPRLSAPSAGSLGRLPRPSLERFR